MNHVRAAAMVGPRRLYSLSNSGKIHALEGYCLKHSNNGLTPALDDFYSAIYNKYQDKAGKMISKMEAILLHQAVSFLRPRRILELGTFAGFSAFVMADALSKLPGERSLDTCDIREEPVNFAKSYANSHLKDCLSICTFHIKDGLDYLKECGSSVPPFDFILIDADKGNYINYFDCIHERRLLADQGTIVIDNTLFRGQVEGPFQSPNATAKKIHDFNQHILQQYGATYSILLLPIFDGVSIVRRKETQ